MTIRTAVLILVALAPIAAPAQYFAPTVSQNIQAPAGRPVLADMDGDGDADHLYFADGNATWGNGVIVMVNGSIGATNVAYFLPVPAATAHTLAVGDVDGDGDRDIVTCNQSSFSVFHVSGVSVSRVDTSLPTPRALVNLVDLDGDLDLDILLDAHEVWLNDGTGTFLLALPINAFANPVPGIAVRPVDFDQDGDLDLVCTWSVGVPPSFLYPSGSHNTWLATIRQDPLGTWTVVSNALGFTDRIPAFAEMADLDGDGDRELVLGLAGGIGGSGPTNLGGASANLYTADVTGGVLTSFVTAPIPGAPYYWPEWGGVLATGDVDGDGAAEIAIIGSYPNVQPIPPLVVFVRVSPGGYTSWQYASVPFTPIFAAITRYDSDTKPDLVAVGHLFTNSSQRLMVRQNEALVGPITMSIVSGDQQVVTSGPPTFAQPFVVQVTDGNGAPLAGRDVFAPLVSVPNYLSTSAPFATTDANGVAALSPLISNFFSGPLLLTARSMTESVTFNAFLRRLTVNYSPVAGNFIQTHLTELLNEPFVIAYDAPGISIPTPYGIVKTGILAPLPTTVIRDGMGAFGPPDPLIVSDGTGVWFKIDVIPVFLRNSGLPIVVQSYAAPAAAPWFVSNATTIIL